MITRREFLKHTGLALAVLALPGTSKVITPPVSVNTLLFLPKVEETKTAGDFLKPALYFSLEMRLEQALREMQRKGQRFAIVLDQNRVESRVSFLRRHAAHGQLLVHAGRAEFLFLGSAALEG